MRNTSVDHAEERVLSLLLIVHDAVRHIYDLKHELFLIVLFEVVTFYLDVPFGHVLRAVINQKDLLFDSVLSGLNDIQNVERPDIQSLVIGKDQP